MTFRDPVYLLGLLAVPVALLALAAARRRPARYVVRFPATATLVAVAGRGGRARRLTPPALLSVALAALAFALARPEATVAVPVEKASVMLVTDTSGSMNATDVSPTRLAAAQAAAAHFVDKVPRSLQIGLVAFADGPHTVLRPTQDRTQLKATLAALQADGGTATGDALASALTAVTKPAAIVLLSDGASTSGRDATEVARQAKAKGVPVYTVALGTADGIVQAGGRTLSVPPDREALAAIAQLSGGKAFAAEDADALDQVYTTLGSRIGTKKVKREVSAGFAAAGLLALGGAALASLRWRGRLP